MKLLITLIVVVALLWLVVMIGVWIHDIVNSEPSIFAFEEEERDPVLRAVHGGETEDP